MFSTQTNLKKKILPFPYHLNKCASSSCFINIQPTCFLVNKLLFEEAESFIIMHLYFMFTMFNYNMLYSLKVQGCMQATTQIRYVILYLEKQCGLEIHQQSFCQTHTLHYKVFLPSGDFESVSCVWTVKRCSQSKSMSQNLIERCCHGKKADIVTLETESGPSLYQITEHRQLFITTLAHKLFLLSQNKVKFYQSFQDYEENRML